MSQQYLILDYETRSTADLKRVGAFEYARHTSTRIMCAAYRYGDKAWLKKLLDAKTPPFIWSPAFRPQPPEDLLDRLSDSDTIIVAHNALFEQVITRFCLRNSIPMAKWPKSIPHERWMCTAAMAASLALPRNLEGACSALNLSVQKDMDGRKLMLKMSKPRKATKDNTNPWHSKMSDLNRLMQYCQKDVDAETALFLSIPELTETERKVWLLDQKINFRGFEVDRDLVEKVLDMIETETIGLNLHTSAITHNLIASTNQRAMVLKFVKDAGFELPDLRAKTVSDALKKGEISGTSKELLEIRQSISKTSTAKYEAFSARSRTDGRLRDILVYHAASTGRWGGSGVQPQNFPRGNIKDTSLAAQVLRSGDLELVRLIYGSPMEAFASCLRGCIVAPKGKEFFCADYASIEARVLFWLANHTQGIKAFVDARPVYEEMAAVIYNIDHYENVTKEQRQVGKQAFLGCGYGMGPKKFKGTCENFGMQVTDELAQTAVKAYREFHSPVVGLWSNLEKAAVAAVIDQKRKFIINNTKWWVKMNFLWCELPSGRRLAYYKPQIKYEPTPWGEKRPVLYHYSVNPLSKKWELAHTYGGKLTENVVQAVARDLMAAAMLRIEDAGYEIVLSVHDELLAERKKGEGSLEEFEDLMAAGLNGDEPAWAIGCPIKVSGWVGERYKK